MLCELPSEGFAPFVVTQTRVQQDDRRDDTKRMIRLCHASQIDGCEANEIILLNSRDGTSSERRRQPTVFLRGCGEG